jgi:hypothetical protein
MLPEMLLLASYGLNMILLHHVLPRLAHETCQLCPLIDVWSSCAKEDCIAAVKGLTALRYWQPPCTTLHQEPLRVNSWLQWQAVPSSAKHC